MESLNLKKKKKKKMAISISLKSLLVALLVELVIISSSYAGKDVMDGEMSTLQKHVSFFDRNNDGIIYPTETFQGCRAIGMGVSLSMAAAAFINGALSPKTRDGGPPDPRLPIYIKNINRAKHGSDTDAYDTEGRFVPEKFEEIFQKHAHTNPNALTEDELKEMLKANQEPNDFAGWIGAYTEWKILYNLCKDKDGLLQKETVRAVYDGSLFQQLEKANGSSQN